MTFRRPSSLEIHWDGSVQAVYPTSDQAGEVSREAIGTVDSGMLGSLQPAFDHQRRLYGEIAPGEELKDGAIVFDVSAEGEVGIENEGSHEFVVGQAPRPNGIVTRESGGVSFHNIDLTKMPADDLNRAAEYLLSLVQSNTTD